MVRIVIVVQQVVQRTGMPGVCLEHALEDAADLLLNLAARQALTAAFGGISGSDQASRHRPQEGERIERRRIGIRRIGRVDACHRVGIRAMAGRRIAVAEEDLHGREVRLLARVARLCRARSRRRAQRREHRSRRRDVLVAPERLVVRQRLAPVREDEPWIDLPRALKRLVRVLVLEVVQRGEPLAEHLARAAWSLRSAHERRRQSGGGDLTLHRSAPRERRRTRRAVGS